MTTVDYIVLVGYIFGVLAVGVVFAKVNKTPAEMFAAGGRSPWWAAGLSSFMTMFSAGTFVVWGGIAYKHGLVAVAINLCYGVAALLAGYLVAGRWKALNIRTPAEYVRVRFGVAALHFYTWVMMLFRMVGVGVTLYALAVLMVPMMPLDESNLLCDPATGHLSLPLAILLLGAIVATYTLIGGLWAVLVTDVLQFIVLNIAVLFVLPLAFMQVGGWRSFVDAAPEGFFTPVTDRYTWFFLVGWCALHFFMIGAEWAFVQRYLCVPTERDARKGNYLFGLLYLISPLVWMLPPMIWRVQNPIPAGANEADIQLLGEQAYIRACQAALPSGMIGMMLAAMFSATASTVSGQLNVFAGVLTNDIFRPLAKTFDDKKLVTVGRLFTLALGIIITGIALAVPYLGGAERIVVAVTTLAFCPLFVPSLTALMVRNVGQSVFWWTVAICFPLIAAYEVSTLAGESAGSDFFATYWNWMRANSSSVEILLGVVLPLVVSLIVVAFSSRQVASGWQRLALLPVPELPPANATDVGRLSIKVIGWSIAACSATLALLAAINEDSRGILAGFSLGMLLIASGILFSVRNSKLSSESRG